MHFDNQSTNLEDSNIEELRKKFDAIGQSDETKNLAKSADVSNNNQRSSISSIAYEIDLNRTSMDTIFPSASKLLLSMEEIRRRIKLISNEIRHSHCSIHCFERNLFQISPNERELQTRDPFLKPILFGFQRILMARDRINLAVSYIGPCGRLLNTISDVDKYLKAIEYGQNRLDLDNFTFSINYFSESAPKWLEIKAKIDDVSLGSEPIPVTLLNTLEPKIEFQSNLFQYVRFPFFEEKTFEEIKSIIEPGPGCQCQAPSCYQIHQCCCVGQCKKIIYGGQDIENGSRRKTKRTNGGGRSKNGKQGRKELGQQINEISNDENYSNYVSMMIEKGQSVDYVVYECNPQCSCFINSGSCVNRAVSKGTKCQIQMFHTKNKGIGVRSTHFIPRGMFVAPYSGIMTMNKFDRKSNDEYYFDLGVLKRSIEGRLLIDKSDPNDPTWIFCDGLQFGNMARYINHSCVPNLHAQTVIIENDRKQQIPIIAFFALRDIPPYVELTFDYQYPLNERVDIRCQCQALSCRYRLR